MDLPGITAGPNIEAAIGDGPLTDWPFWGPISPTPAPAPSSDPGLDFSKAGNSQYIPFIL